MTRTSLFHALRLGLLDLRNMVDYPLRQFFRWQRQGLLPRRQVGLNRFEHLPESERTAAEAGAREMRSLYHLDSFAEDSSVNNYRENLYYLQLLEQALNASDMDLPEQVEAADIGPSSWFYVQALHAALEWWHAPHGRQVRLSGYEVDAYRVYANLHSRFDHAQSHMRGLNDVEYIAEGFFTQPGRFDLITMFFPFVFPKDHIEWGLPTHLFSPQRLLESAWQSLKPGGALVIVNQGMEEHERERQMLDGVGIAPLAAFRFDSLYYSYPIERYVLVAIHGR